MEEAKPLCGDLRRTQISNHEWQETKRFSCFVLTERLMIPNLRLGLGSVGLIGSDAVEFLIPEASHPLIFIFTPSQNLFAALLPNVAQDTRLFALGLQARRA